MNLRWLKFSKEERERIGSSDLTDPFGNPLRPGTIVLYPSEGPDRSTQLTLARVLDYTDKGLHVQPIRRTRSGRVNGKYNRTKVLLRNLSNVVAYPWAEV